jgi:hypothetical protein
VQEIKTPLLKIILLLTRETEFKYAERKMIEREQRRQQSNTGKKRIV